MYSGTAEQEQKRVITEPGGATVPGAPPRPASTSHPLRETKRPGNETRVTMP